MTPPNVNIIVTEQELSSMIDDLTNKLVDQVNDEWTIVCILMGATFFVADLMKSLARREVHPKLDMLWLESYGDERESSGRVVVRADIARPIEGRKILLVDDVFDTGRTLAFAKSHLMTKGASEVVTSVLARKENVAVDGSTVDYFAFDAPNEFLIGYGMDDAGKYRGFPHIGVVNVSNQQQLPIEL